MANYVSVGDRVFTLDMDFNVIPYKVTKIKTITTEDSAGEHTHREFEVMNENDGNDLNYCEETFDRMFFGAAWDLYSRVNDQIEAIKNEENTNE